MVYINYDKMSSNQQKQDCEMCGGHNSAYDDDEDCDTWTSVYENYIVCDDCIPPDDICSVKEWNERWTKKGKNTFDFDEMCWKKKKLRKKKKKIVLVLEEEDEDVCCVVCGERVCGFHEDPPYKDLRDEAVCEDCVKCLWRHEFTTAPDYEKQEEK